MPTLKSRSVAFACTAGLMALTAVFACSSSNEGATSRCDGAACVDDAAAPTTADGPADAPRDNSTMLDAAPDAADETFDAGTCPLRSPDASAGDSGALRWASSFGITKYTTASRVAIDPANDDIVVVGSFDGTADFGGGTATAQGQNDIFVARFDKSGATNKWAKTFSSGQFPSADAVGIGPAGHVVVGGTMSSSLPGASLDFGCGALTGDASDDVFVVDFDAGGNCVWSKRFSVNSSRGRLGSLAVDTKGNVFLSGPANQADFGGGPLAGYYLAKLTPTGAHVWSKGFAGVASAISESTVAVDSEGNSLFAGSFQGTADFGGGVVTSVESRTAFVAKYSPSGKYQWTKRFAAVPTVPASKVDSAITGIAVDGCGGAFVTGNFGRTTTTFGDHVNVAASIDLGSGTLAAPDTASYYGFLAKLDAAGSGVWSKVIVASNTSGTGAGAMTSGSVAVDGAGRPTITAFVSGDCAGHPSSSCVAAAGDQESVDFGAGPLTIAGDQSFAIASFDAAGAYRWAYVGAAPSTFRYAYARGVAASKSSSSVVLVGRFGRAPDVPTPINSLPGTTLDIAGTTLTASGAADMFLASFTP